MWAFIVVPAFLISLWASRFVLIMKMEQAIFKRSKLKGAHIEKAREKGVQSVAISSGEDELLGHWLEVKPDSPAVFICHGNEENVGDWLEAQLMLKYMGYSTFVFDYAGYGHSKGFPSVNNLNLNAHDAWCTFCKLTNKSTSRIALGHSIGGAVLLNCLRKQMFFPDRLVLHGTFTSVKKFIVHSGKVDKKWGWILPDIWNNKKNLMKILAIPTKVVHSHNDEQVPYDMGKSLAYNRDDIEFKSIDAYAHNQLYLKPDTKLWEALLK